MTFHWILFNRIIVFKAGGALRGDVHVWGVTLSVGPRRVEA